MTSDQFFSYISSLVCVLFSARIATVFLKGNSRLFTVMALFACVWALLLPFYSNLHSELFPAYGGFLLVYMGGLLIVESERRKGKHDDREVVFLQRLGLHLLVVIAGPQALGVAAPNFTVGLSRPQTEILLATLLNTTGYAAITVGGWALFRRPVAAGLAVLLTLYGLLEIVYTIVMWPSTDLTKEATAPPYLNYLFGTAKLLFAAMFGCAVASEGMDPRTASEGLPKHIQRFFLG